MATRRLDAKVARTHPLTDALQELAAHDPERIALFERLVIQASRQGPAGKACSLMSLLDCGFDFELPRDRLCQLLDQIIEAIDGPHIQGSDWRAKSDALRTHFVEDYGLPIENVALNDRLNAVLAALERALGIEEDRT